MKSITCYFDVVSPYAYLAFEALPQALQGISHTVDYKPVLLAALLRQHGQLGPAEVPSKRQWMYRDVQWQARRLGVVLDLPAAHPFNPLPLLRLALACSADSCVNRWVCEAVFRHVWRGGAAAHDAGRLQALTQTLKPLRDPTSSEVKEALRANTAEALGRGVFGVPSWWVDDKLLWGLDALPMLRACAQGEPWFASAAWHAGDQLPVESMRADARMPT